MKGWKSTDTEEIIRRRKRGESELFTIENLEPEQPVFGTFGVQSLKGVPYQVEIRSLRSLDNSCDCPDFAVNGLGTCKHIEGVVQHLNKCLGEEICQAELDGSNRTEIYLRRREGVCEVRVTYADNEGPAVEARKVLDPLFSSSGKLLSHPLIGIPALRNALSLVPEEVQAEIRFSQHIQPWVDELARTEERKRAREEYLADVESGKRSNQLIKVPLHPYQHEGALHLAFSERAMLADEMGLGKTVQAIAACELLRRLKDVQRVLVVAPASLKSEWEEQIAKFVSLPTTIIRGDRSTRLALYRQHSFFYLATYEQIRNDYADIQSILAPEIIILDEAQRVKNWQTKTAWAVKQLKSPYMFVLTGTPIENRIDEIYSLMQVIDSKILGPLFRFNREFYELDENGNPVGHRNLDRLHQLLRPTVLRRRKHEVEEQLPGRTIKNYFVKMSEEQEERYGVHRANLAKLFLTAKKRPLTKGERDQVQQNLACMRMICDSCYILDENCHAAPKLDELKEILSDVLTQTDNKIIIFSEWQRMLELVRDELKRTHTDFAWHTGTVPHDKRRAEINRFKQDPHCRVFLSTDSGSTGLNLQVASVVVNVDLPWNPAKLEQRIARAWRKNQTKSVHVVNLIAENTIEHRMLQVLAQKQNLADGVLDGGTKEGAVSVRRFEMMDHLEQLMGQQVTKTSAVTRQEPETRDTFDAIRTDLLAYFNDRLQLLEEHVRPDGSSLLFVVVDHHGDQVRERIESIVVGHVSPPPFVELLDISTYEIIQRMVVSGVLRRNDELKRTLFRAASLTVPRQAFTELRETWQSAERKGKMASVLRDAGFVMEALPAAKEALELTEKCQRLMAITVSGVEHKNCDSEHEAKRFIQSVEELLSTVSEQVHQLLLG